ncbi:MAG: leucine-rich repeat protein [Lachnospiraceae bacterium]|nr:leucine-rich repeat protein [Lachnospiraceae bacterium]
MVRNRIRKLGLSIAIFATVGMLGSMPTYAGAESDGTDDEIVTSTESEEEIETEQLTQYASTSGRCGRNATYTLDDNGVFTITGTGVINNSYGVQFMNLPIKKVIIPEGVTGIDQVTFAQCKELEEVSFPSTLTTINLMAFAECSALKEVVLPDGISTVEHSAFSGCTGMERLVIPGSLTTIEDSVFTGCKALKDLVIAEGVTTIGKGAFWKCTNLREISFPDSLTTIEEQAFMGSGLKSVTIPAGVSVIQKNVFNYCKDLEEVIIPDHVTTIEEGAFGNCPSLKEIYISGSVTINPNAFDESGLRKVTLGYGITTINDEAFIRCANLEEVIIPDSVTTMGDYVFCRCSNLKRINIPDSVTTLGAYAFIQCYKLEEVKLSANLTEIAPTAFGACSGLKQIAIPSQVTKIWFDAFSGCTKLESIAIPKSLTEVQENAFASCYKLTDVYYEGSEEEWNRIRIESGNNALKNATIHFNTTTLPQTPEQQRATREFVTRMYDVVLGRMPDEEGLNTWTDNLNSGRSSAVDIVYGFFYSPEYLNKGKSNGAIVTDCYNAMLGRDPDPSGYADWTKRLDIGMTPEAIFAGFVGSQEFIGLCRSYGIEPGQYQLTNARDQNYERTYFVYRLYQNCLGRTPDADGQESWCATLGRGDSGANVAYGFIFSPEYLGRNTDNEEYVAMLYQTILGRAGDAAGMQSWIDQLNNGSSREHILNGFLFSTEFAQQCETAGINVGSPIPEP